MDTGSPSLSFTTPGSKTTLFKPCFLADFNFFLSLRRDLLVKPPIYFFTAEEDHPPSLSLQLPLAPRQYGGRRSLSRCPHRAGGFFPTTLPSFFSPYQVAFVFSPWGQPPPVTITSATVCIVPVGWCCVTGTCDRCCPPRFFHTSPPAILSQLRRFDPFSLKNYDFPPVYPADSLLLLEERFSFLNAASCLWFSLVPFASRLPFLISSQTGSQKRRQVGPFPSPPQNSQLGTDLLPPPPHPD